MGIKVIFQQFYIKSKESKKEIIIWGIIISLITTLIIDPSISHLYSVLGPKPSIESNVIIIRNANISHLSVAPTKLENFFFFYYLGEESSTLFFANASDIAKQKDYEMSLLPTYEICPECLIYSFSLKNVGNKKAEKIVIDIKAQNIPELLSEEPKMTKRACGGLFQSTGCYIIFENVNENEEISFVLLSKQQSEIFVTTCQADDKYPCDFRFFRILSQKIDPKKEVLKMNGKEIRFPTKDTFEPNKVYYFNAQEFTQEKTGWIYYK